MEKQPGDYVSYLLRLWRTSKENPWRASLEDPRTGERLGFGSLEALWEFLHGKTEATLPKNATEANLEVEKQLS